MLVRPVMRRIFCLKAKNALIITYVHLCILKLLPGTTVRCAIQVPTGEQKHQLWTLLFVVGVRAPILHCPQEKAISTFFCTNLRLETPPPVYFLVQYSVTLPQLQPHFSSNSPPGDGLLGARNTMPQCDSSFRALQAPRHYRWSLRMWLQRVEFGFSRGISKWYFYNITIKWSTVLRQKKACKWRSNWMGPSLAQVREPRIWSKCLEICSTERSVILFVP